MTNFRIDIVIDPKGAEQGRKVVERELEKIEKKSSDVLDELGKIGAAIGITLLARKVAGLALTYQDLQNRLRTVTETEQERAELTKELFALADRTRSDVSSSIELYVRLSRAVKDLGKSQEELLAFTEGLNQAVTLSGATAEEASAGILQLSQGLASGVLRGDEFRSVSEQLTGVLDVLSQSLGKSRAELRKMAGEGKLTTEIIFEAFTKQGKSLQEQFQAVAPTVGSTFQQLQNGLLAYVGNVDQSIGATKLFSEALQILSLDIGHTVAISSVLVTLIGVSLAQQAIPRAIKAFRALGTAATGPLGLIALGVGAIIEEFNFVNEVAGDTEEALRNTASDATLTQYALLGDQIKRVTDRLAQLRKDEVNSGEETAVRSNEIAKLTARLKDLQKQRTAVAEAEKRALSIRSRENEEYQNFLGSLNSEFKLLQLSNDEREIQAKLLTAVAKISKKGDIGPDEVKELERLIRRNSALNDEVKVLNEIRGPEEERAKRLGILNKLLEEGKITAEEFKREVQKQAEVQIELPTIGALDDTSIANLKKVLEALSSQFEKTGGDAKAFGDAATQAILAATANAPDLRSQLEALNKLFQDGTITAEQFAAAKDKALGPSEAEEYARQLDDLLLRLEAGKISQDQFNNAVLDLRIAALESSTAFEDGFTRAILKIKKEAEDLASVAEQTVNVFADAGVDALTEFAQTGQVNFKALADAVVQDLLRIISRLLIIQALNAVFGGEAAPAVQAGSNIAVQGARAEGGPMQPGNRYLVGEKGPEVVQVGTTSTVFPNQAAAAPEVKVQVTNVTDPNEVPRAISSGQADQDIINVLTRNREKLRRLVT